MRVALFIVLVSVVTGIALGYAASRMRPDELAPSLGIDTRCSERVEALRSSEGARTLFIGVARLGDLEALDTLLLCGVAVDLRDGSGRTALSIASYHGHEALVAKLLANGADVNIGDAVGLTPLMNASFRGHERIVRTLLAHGARVDQANVAGQTALMFASLFGRRDVVASLVSAGADARREDVLGFSGARLADVGSQGAAVERFLRPIAGALR